MARPSHEECLEIVRVCQQLQHGAVVEDAAAAVGGAAVLADTAVAVDAVAVVVVGRLGTAAVGRLAVEQQPRQS